jgi:hypothetical protein
MGLAPVQVRSARSAGVERDVRVRDVAAVRDAAVRDETAVVDHEDVGTEDVRKAVDVRRGVRPTRRPVVDAEQRTARERCAGKKGDQPRGRDATER